MLKRWRFAALSVPAALLALTFGPTATPAAEPFTIDAVLPLTGAGAFIGKEQADALHVIEHDVNATGGVRGRPIRFAIQDDQSSPTVALQLVSGLIASRARVIIGPSQSGNCNAVAPLVKDGPVLYCLSPGVFPDPGSFEFSAGMSTASYSTATIRFLEAKGWRRLALISSNDSVGRDGDKVIQDALDARSHDSAAVTMVDREHFNPTDINVTAQLARIAASQPDVVIVWTTGTPFGTVVRDAFQLGAAIPLLGAGSNLDYKQLISYESFIPPGGLYFISAPWSALDRLPRSPVRAAIASYFKAFQTLGLQPAQTAGFAWDSAWIVLNAFKTLGYDATAAQIRAHIAGLTNYVGVNGLYNFVQQPQRGANADWVVIVRWDPRSRTVSAISKPGGAPL